MGITYPPAVFAVFGSPCPPTVCRRESSYPRVIYPISSRPLSRPVPVRGKRNRSLPPPARTRARERGTQVFPRPRMYIHTPAALAATIITQLCYPISQIARFAERTGDAFEEGHPPGCVLTRLEFRRSADGGAYLYEGRPMAPRYFTIKV